MLPDPELISGLDSMLSKETTECTSIERARSQGGRSGRGRNFNPGCLKKRKKGCAKLLASFSSIEKHTNNNNNDNDK